MFVDYFILFESDRWKVPEYSRSVFLLKFNFSTCSRFIPVPLENLTDRLSFVSLYFRKIQETTFLINMTNHPWDNKFNNFFFWPRMTTWFVDDHGNFENLEIIFLCWSTQPPVIESLKPKNMTIDTYRSCNF